MVEYGADRRKSDLRLPVLSRPEGRGFFRGNGKSRLYAGKNGAGKSTLFRCILGLLKGYHGKIMADGVDLRTLKEKELARKIAYIPQNHDQAFAFSVLDMVMMGTTSSLQGLKSPGREQRRRHLMRLRP